MQIRLWGTKLIRKRLPLTDKALVTEQYSPQLMVLVPLRHALLRGDAPSPPRSAKCPRRGGKTFLVPL